MKKIWFSLTGSNSVDGLDLTMIVVGLLFLAWILWQIWNAYKQDAVKVCFYNVGFIKDHKEVGNEQCLDWFIEIINLSRWYRINEIRFSEYDMPTLAEMAHRGYLVYASTDQDKKRAEIFYDEYLKREEVVIDEKFISIKAARKTEAA